MSKQPVEEQNENETVEQDPALLRQQKLASMSGLELTLEEVAHNGFPPGHRFNPVIVEPTVDEQARIDAVTSENEGRVKYADQVALIIEQLKASGQLR